MYITSERPRLVNDPRLSYDGASRLLIYFSSLRSLGEVFTIMAFQLTAAVAFHKGFEIQCAVPLFVSLLLPVFLGLATLCRMKATVRILHERAHAENELVDNMSYTTRIIISSGITLGTHISSRSMWIASLPSMRHIGQRGFEEVTCFRFLSELRCATRKCALSNKCGATLKSGP